MLTITARYMTLLCLSRDKCPEFYGTFVLSFVPMPSCERIEDG